MAVCWGWLAMSSAASAQASEQPRRPLSPRSREMRWMNAFGAGERLTSASPMDAERGDPGETLGAADLGQTRPPRQPAAQQEPEAHR